MVCWWARCHSGWPPGQSLWSPPLKSTSFSLLSWQLGFVPLENSLEVKVSKARARMSDNYSTLQFLYQTEHSIFNGTGMAMGDCNCSQGPELLQTTAETALKADRFEFKYVGDLRWLKTLWVSVFVFIYEWNHSFQPKDGLRYERYLASAQRQ